MDKAYLVLDMPTSCDACEFAKENSHNNEIYCDNPLSSQYGKYVTDYMLCRADGCPFKLFPEKRPTEMNTINDDINKLVYNEGYNECINDLLKETK